MVFIPAMPACWWINQAALFEKALGCTHLPTFALGQI